MFAAILGIINGVIPALPALKELVDGVKPLLSGAEQAELQSALEAAIARSDAAQADFTKASRGQ